MNGTNEYGFPTSAYTPDQDNNPSEQTIISTTQPASPGGPPAEFIPGYELVRELGRGGMGVVYLARQQGLNRLVAIKMVLAGKHASDNDLARFKAEAGAVAQLQHPQIVQVFETGEYQGNPWFSMEYVDGGSLDKRLQGRPLPPREAARVINQLADAVAHAHTRGVLHRDLKPGNILLQRAETASLSVDSTQRNLRAPTKSNTINLDLGSKDGLESQPMGPVTLKVTDFGLAKQLEAGVAASSRTQDGTVLGSPSYMAPEQAAGNLTELGPATDVYALGAILYELLTGRPPFRASTAWDTVLQVLHDEPVPPTRLQPRLPRDLETICLKCLAKDPKRRYASVGELEADLEHFLNDEPILARPTPWWERTWKAARRRPALTTLVLTAILAVSAIIWLVLDNNHRLQHERDLARNAQSKAERERSNAQLRLEQSAEAIERLLINTSSGTWSRRPEMQEERKKLLEEVITFYQVFLDQENDDPLLRRQAAQAYYRMAGVYLFMGEIRKAEEKLARAREIQDNLIAEFPDNADYKHDQVQTINLMGNAEVMRGQFSRSEHTYDKAVRQAETLAKAFPNKSEYQLTLVQAYLSQSRFYAGAAKPAMALEMQKKAFDVAKAVYEKDSKPYAHRLAYASTLLQRAQVLVNADRAAAAEPFLAELKPILDSLVDMTAPSAQLRDQFDSISGAYVIINGYYLVRTGRQEEGEAELRRGVKLLDDLLASRPKVFPLRTLQINALNTLGNTLEKRKGHEARETIQRAFQLQEELAKDVPDMPWLRSSGVTQRSMMLVIRAREGNLVGLEESMKELLLLQIVQAGSQDPKYNIACAYAQGSKHLKDPAEQERWAAKAVQTLEELYKTKYFRPQQIRHLASDADLDPLRHRSDFQAFLKHFQNLPHDTFSVTVPSPPNVQSVPRKVQLKFDPSKTKKP